MQILKLIKKICYFGGIENNHLDVPQEKMQLETLPIIKKENWRLFERKVLWYILIISDDNFNIITIRRAVHHYVE